MNLFTKKNASSKFLELSFLTALELVIILNYVDKYFGIFSMSFSMLL